jgi:hypothetical protein
LLPSIIIFVVTVNVIIIYCHYICRYYQYYYIISLYLLLLSIIIFVVTVNIIIILYHYICCYYQSLLLYYHIAHRDAGRIIAEQVLS